MDRAQALEILTSHQEEIISNYSVRHLGLFGSTARDDARKDSKLSESERNTLLFRIHDLQEQLRPLNVVSINK